MPRTILIKLSRAPDGSWAASTHSPNLGPNPDVKGAQDAIYALLGGLGGGRAQ